MEFTPILVGSGTLTGQITVTTAGTEVQGADVKAPNGVIVRALSANTGKMYVGRHSDGTVSSSTGFELAAGEKTYLPIPNVKDMWVDSSVDGEKVCWSLA